jgi:hypothetical protein
MQKQWLLSECISRKGETNILIWFSAEAKRGKLVLIKDLKTVQTEISVDFFYPLIIKWRLLNIVSIGLQFGEYSRKNWRLLPISPAMSFRELLTSSVCPFSPSM